MEQFYFHNDRWNHGYDSFCRVCSNISRRELTRRGRARIKAWKLEKGCSICGYKKCASALDFHHVTGKKYKVISQLYGSRNMLERELKKCVVSCKNCHAEEEEGKRQERRRKAPVAVVDPPDDDVYDDLQPTMDL